MYYLLRNILSIKYVRTFCIPSAPEGLHHSKMIIVYVVMVEVLVQLDASQLSHHYLIVILMMLYIYIMVLHYCICSLYMARSCLWTGLSPPLVLYPGAIMVHAGNITSTFDYHNSVNFNHSNFYLPKILRV